MNALKFYLLKANKSILVKNFGWNIGGNAARQIINPLFFILLARILEPNDFGIFGIAMAFMAFVNLIKDFGLQEAIIVDNRKADFISLQFTFQIFFSMVLYGVIIILSPYISSYYKIEDLEKVLKIIGLMVFLSAVEDPLLTHYLKNNEYKTLFFRRLIPALVFGSVALALAYLKFGVYALIIAQIAGIFASTLFLLFKSNWRPKIYFNFEIIKSLIRMGKHIILQKFCGLLVSQADSLIIGKNIGVSGVGFYQLGGKFSRLIPNSIFSQMQQVIFTDMAKNKENVQYVRKRYFQFVFLGWVFAIILSIGTFLLAPYFVYYILGEKWQDLTWVIQFFCLQVHLIPLVGLNIWISRVYGFYHVYSFFNVAIAVLTLGAVICASFYSLKMVLFAWVVTALIGAVSSSIVFFKFQKQILFDYKLIIIFALAIIYIFSGLLYLCGLI